VIAVFFIYFYNFLFYYIVLPKLSTRKIIYALYAMSMLKM